MWRSVGMAVAFGALLGGCGEQSTDIPIGAIGPMTGKSASFGAQMKLGVELAVGDINAAGGVNGKPLRLIIEDDVCDPKQAVAGANKLAGQHVKLVVGHFCSGSSIPASKVYAEEQIIQISPGSTSPAFTDDRAGPTIFRVCGRDDQQGGVAGAYIAKTFSDKNVAFLNDRSTYGKGLAEETKKAMNAAGKQEVMFEAYTAGDSDFSALVSKMKAAAVDVVFLGGYYTEGGLIVRQMRDQGMNAILIGGDALVTKAFWQITGDAGEGTLMTFSPDARKYASAAAVVKRFNEKGLDPEGYVLYSYAAVQAWAAAATEAKSVDTKAVLEKLNAMEHDTVLGKFRFDAKGDPNLPPYTFYRWSKGTYTQIE